MVSYFINHSTFLKNFDVLDDVTFHIKSVKLNVISTLVKWGRIVRCTFDVTCRAKVVIDRNKLVVIWDSNMWLYCNFLENKLTILHGRLGPIFGSFVTKNILIYDILILRDLSEKATSMPFLWVLSRKLMYLNSKVKLFQWNYIIAITFDAFIKLNQIFWYHALFTLSVDF